jgi:GNAT superfamily N-acetyltransferase
MMTLQIDIQFLNGRAEFTECFELMKQLRPDLKSAQQLAEQLDRQLHQNYRLMGARQGGIIVGLAGFREMENLLCGRFIYVDDLVVDADVRKLGIGARLLDAVRNEAVSRGCAHLVLDTGLHMPLAQRFYFREGLLAKGMHFVEPLSMSS